jgi:hypothetical protein
VRVVVVRRSYTDRFLIQRTASRYISLNEALNKLVREAIPVEEENGSNGGEAKEK